MDVGEELEELYRTRGLTDESIHDNIQVRVFDAVRAKVPPFDRHKRRRRLAAGAHFHSIDDFVDPGRVVGRQSARRFRHTPDAAPRPQPAGLLLINELNCHWLNFVPSCIITSMARFPAKLQSIRTAQCSLVAQ